MKKILLNSAIVASSLMITLQAAPISKDDALVTHTELGYIKTDGNTNTETFNLDAKAKKGWKKHIFEVTFDGQYATSDNIENKNKYFIELTYNYDLTNKLSINYLAGYKADKFSSFSYQFYTGPGAKYKAIQKENHKLAIEGNILYSIDQYQDINYDASGNSVAYPNPNNTPIASTISGEKNDYASYRIKGNYDWQIKKDLKFNQELTFRGSFDNADNYFVYSKTSLMSKISDIFSAGLSYKVDYTNLPIADKKSTDTTLTFNLIMDY